MTQQSPHYQILTLNQIASSGLKRFPEASYEIGSDIKKPDAILVRSQNMLDMDIPISVKAIGRAGAGVNNIPVDRMSARGTPVFNAPGANANAVNELVMASLLLASRNLVPALRFVHAIDGDDKALHELVEKEKKHYAGVELPERSIGIIGLGAIGSLVAATATKLGMSVLGYDPDLTVDAAWRLPSTVKRMHSIEDLVRHSEFISLHVPLNDKTRRLIDAKRVALMRNSTVLLNFAREGLIDEDAVLEAMASKKLKWYVCDFPTKKLKGHAHVIAFPHLGASTEEAEENCARMVVDQVRDFLEHGNIRNAVNLPDVSMPREALHRVGIVNANVPNMLGQISTTMAHAKLNIHNMLNKSKGDLAYTLVDVDSPISAAVVKKLAAIEGVLSVRAIPPVS
jgi:D-3-phosphoglycerate dehydrogenase / 2-oxoglutarate reductase